MEIIYEGELEIKESERGCEDFCGCDDCGTVGDDGYCYGD